jgi:hypothetical protein
VNGMRRDATYSLRLAALRRANDVRRARAEVKRKVAQGTLSAVDVLLDPPAAADGCSVAELLMSQRLWGRAKSTRLLSRNRIDEHKAIRDLTERQRRVLADELERARTPVDRAPRHARPGPRG